MHNVKNESFRRVSANLNYLLRSKLMYLLTCNIQSKVLDDLFVDWHHNFIALQLISFIFIRPSNTLRHVILLLPINFTRRVIHYHHIEPRGKVKPFPTFTLKMTGIFPIDISNFARVSISVLCLNRFSQK